jgi:hypothetical protein
MGYTHYWYLKDIEAWKKYRKEIVSDFLALVPHLPPLAGPLGEGEPMFGETVDFNGPAPKDDYESFNFPFLNEKRAREELEEEGKVFGCCKTDRRPYDLAVTAFLLVAQFHLGERLELRSDGDLADWAAASNLVEGVLALPVDLYEVLGARLWLVEAGGKPFLYESGRENSPQKLEGWLKELEQSGSATYFGWPFRGPYKVLQEVRVPQEELAVRRISPFAAYKA